MSYASILYTSASGTTFALTNSEGNAIEYLRQNDISVFVNDVLQTVTTDYTFNAAGTAIVLNTAVSGAEVYITRTTDIDDPVVDFTPGSTLTSTDLNNSNDQYRFALQEFRDTYAALTEGTEDLGEFPGIIDSTEAWISDDSHWPTTATLDNRFVDQLSDETLAGIKTFSSSPVVPTPTTGTQAANKAYVDDNYWNVDGETINLAEQNAGSPAWDDNKVATAAAAAKRFDTIVQTTTPTGTDYEVGKTWLQNDDDKTVSIWNGTTWVAVASGGAFTELAKVVYVDAVNGDDSLAGHRISNPKRTIKAAMDQINAETDANGNGSLIVVAPGIYGEEFPITIEKNDVAIVGTSLRNCIIHPAIGVTAVTAAVNGSEYRIRFVGTTDFTAIGAPDNNVGTVFTATGAGSGTGTLEDTAVQAAYDVDVPEANELATMFQVNSGTYIQNLTLQGMKGAGTRGGNILDTDATFGLPTNQGWNFAFFPGATIRKSPYIQNCTNFSDSQINNVDFTPHVPGEGAAGDLDSDGFAGGGILIDGDVVNINSPLRSMVCDSYTHTALNGPGIFVTNNGYTQVTSSYAFFTHYHLKCLNGGQANLAASTSDFGRYSLIADGRSTTNIFTSNVDGAANDLATTFNINEPVADASWHGNANRPQPNMLVVVNGVTYPILSATPRTDSEGGDGWTVEISRPDPANRSLNLGLDGAVADDAAVQFFLRSQIASSGHTMEYVGSGTDYRALPENATGTFPVGADDPVTADATAGTAPNGVPVEERQIIVLNNGAIWTAVTDHNGKFRVGGDQNTDPTYEVDQQLGQVSFRTGSLGFPNLIQNLDTNGFNIFDSTGHVNINDELDVNSNKIVNVSDPTNAQDAATKNYVDSQVSVADKIEEGNSSVEVVDTGSNGTITFTTEGSAKATIDSSGRLLVGTTSDISAGSSNTSIQVRGASNNLTGELWLARNETSTTADGDEAGKIAWVARDPAVAAWRHTAYIISDVDGTPGNSSMPGRIEFHTNSGSFAGAPTERMRIDSSGRVGIGGIQPSDALHVQSSAGNLRIDTSTNAGSASLLFDVPASNGLRASGHRAKIACEHQGSGWDSSLVFYAGTTSNTPSEAFRVDASRRLLVGSTSTAADGRLFVTGNQGAATQGMIHIQRGEASTNIDSQDWIGQLKFADLNGGEFAMVACRADAAPSSGDHPGRLEFWTTPDGSGSPVERWRINNEGILTNQNGNHAHGSQDFINNYRCQFAVYASAEAGTNGNSAVGTGPFDSTYEQSEWGNKTLTYGMAQELRSEYNLQQTSRCNIGASFFAANTAGNDNSFPDGGSGSSYWTPYSAAVWARGANNGGYQGFASVRADCQGYYGSSAAYYARVKSSPTSGRGHGFHCDLGGHVFGNNNVGFFVRQIDDQSQTGCTGFLYRRHNTNNTFNVLEVRNGANSTIGSIRCTNSNTSFNTSSDYRLKENVTPVTNGIELIKQMPVKSFNFIGNAEPITGFLAHEIQDVAPYAVQGVKDGTKQIPATDENGQAILSDEEVDGVKQPVMETVPDYQSVDYGKLTPILTAALQEAIAKIETLEARLTALETP